MHLTSATPNNDELEQLFETDYRHRWKPKYQFKNIWIDLSKLAEELNTVKSNNKQDDVERFELLLDFLHYISDKCSYKPFYLQMLRSSAIELKIDFEQIESGIIELFLRFETFETNLLASSYDDLDEELTAWLKNAKMIAPIVERFRDKLRVIAKKIPGQTQTIISKLVCGIYQETLIINLSNSSKTNTPLVEGQCVMINIGTELPDTRRFNEPIDYLDPRPSHH
ncbi:unnamed protein product [Rotaria socialis]|uniref:Uncharacterized protein n=1 Tax=Rotaria socialis TaxID=392032 RepID=A0A820S5Y3_9BILA|nr:unnamed protein product [Rotaria socialis]